MAITFRNWLELYDRGCFLFTLHSEASLMRHSLQLTLPIGSIVTIVLPLELLTVLIAPFEASNASMEA